MATATLEGGFADAPLDAARVFRAALGAMARPGRIERIAGAAPPASLSTAAGALLLTLCDPDTPVFLAGGTDRPDVRDWLAFHTGAPVTGRDRASFAVGNWEALAPLDGYPIGTPEYPDRSTTLIVECDRLAAEGTRLTGPGIAGSAWLSLPETEAFVRNAVRFPLGLDFFFTAGELLAALPRTTCVEVT